MFLHSSHYHYLYINYNEAYNIEFTDKRSLSFGKDLLLIIEKDVCFFMTIDYLFVMIRIGIL